MGFFNRMFGDQETAANAAPAKANDFIDALALDASLAPAYFGLGSAEQGLGSGSARVQELYRKAIELDPAVPVFQQALENLLAAEEKQEAPASTPETGG